MRTILSAIVAAVSFGAGSPHGVSAVASAKVEQVGTQPGSGFHTVLSSAMRYVMNYEQQFALLAAEETYVQELQRPPGPGAVNQQVLKSDYLVVQRGGDGEGWIPFRDTFEQRGQKLRTRDDRLLNLFLKNHKERFAKGADFTDKSAKLFLGNVARTINIPMLGMTSVHPRVHERFEFTDGGEETIGGRLVRKANYREAARPTLIRTTRGRDLALTGAIWIDPLNGTVIKAELNAADQAVHCQVTVTFRRDEALELWVPDTMEESYKADLAVDDILATATYANYRKILRSELPRE